MISFIIPAHNEELFLPKTLESIHRTGRELKVAYEVVVVDDASTDRTSASAQEMGARVVRVNHRQIAATRNSGARAAHGEWLFFVDADTAVTPEAVSSALKRLEKGAVGGGALTRFDDAVPLYAWLLVAWLGVFMRLASLSGGAFLFCTKRAFEGIGGFDERLYGAEDAAFSAALKREGRFVVLRERVPTSGRRVRSVSGLQVLGLLLQVAFLPANLKNRKSVEKIWYVSNRSSETAGQSLVGQASNLCALLIVLVLLSIPLWAVPWPKFLLASPLGHVKHFCGLMVTHVGLVLWPCLLFLLRSFLEQRLLKERLKTGLVMLVCLVLAVGSVVGVYDFWRGVFRAVS